MSDPNPQTEAAPAAGNASRTEPKWPTHHRTAVVVAVAVLIVGVSAPLGYVIEARQSIAFALEYLSYLLPAFAAITAAMTVFEWRVISLFWLSMIFVIAGLAIFTFLHHNFAGLGAMVFIVAGIVLTVSLIPLANRLERKRGKPLKWNALIGLAVLVFVTVEVVTLPGIVRYGLAFTRKPPTFACVEVGRNAAGQLLLECGGD